MSAAMHIEPTRTSAEAPTPGRRLYTVKVPRELKELRGGIDFALYSLALGRGQAVDTHGTDLVTVKFWLTPRAQQYLVGLLASPEYANNRRKVFASALTWLRDQPFHIRLTKVD